MRLRHRHTSDWIPSQESEVLALKQESRIIGQPTNPASGFSMMELCAVWPMDNWLGSSLNQIQGWTTVRESYSCALEQGPLVKEGSDSDEMSVTEQTLRGSGGS